MVHKIFRIRLHPSAHTQDLELKKIVYSLAWTCARPRTKPALGLNFVVVIDSETFFSKFSTAH
jgi:hypothetical protein